jgi:DASS family divalent anion:Na+ symporter
MDAAKKFDIKKLLFIVIPILIGVGIALIPPPTGLERPAMIFMGIFVCAILWLITDVIKDYIVVILAMALFVLLQVSDIKTVFAPFAGSSVWVVIGAFAIAAMVGKCGLLKRIALVVLKIFPENFTGQIMALFATGIVISPMIPSLTAKGAILAPFAASASKALGYIKNSKAAAGMFCAAWISAGILGCAFMSGAVPVFTILGMLPAEAQAEWGWVRWFLAAAIWFVVITVLSFVAILIIYNPKKEKAEEQVEIEKGFAKRQLAELGPMSRNEKWAAIFLALALLGWIFGKQLGIDSGIWAVTIMCLMAIFGLMTPQDFGTRISWSSVFFIGGVFSLAAMISALEINTWLAGLLGPIMEPLAGNPFIFIAVICVATYLLRLVVISQTATLAIFFAALGGVSAASGINPWVLLFVCYMSTLVWHFSFTNVTYASTLGATNGEITDHKQTIPMNIAYLAINLIACLASVPVWKLMGLL